MAKRESKTGTTKGEAKEADIRTAAKSLTGQSYEDGYPASMRHHTNTGRGARRGGKE